jgi:hypothetical protein
MRPPPSSPRGRPSRRSARRSLGLVLRGARGVRWAGHAEGTSARRTHPFPQRGLRCRRTASERQAVGVYPERLVAPRREYGAEAAPVEGEDRVRVVPGGPAGALRAGAGASGYPGRDRADRRLTGRRAQPASWRWSPPGVRRRLPGRSSAHPRGLPVPAVRRPTTGWRPCSPSSPRRASRTNGGSSPRVELLKRCSQAAAADIRDRSDGAARHPDTEEARVRWDTEACRVFWALALSVGMASEPVRPQFTGSRGEPSWVYGIRRVPSSAAAWHRAHAA